MCKTSVRKGIEKRGERAAGVREETQKRRTVERNKERET